LLLGDRQRRLGGPLQAVASFGGGRPGGGQTDRHGKRRAGALPADREALHRRARALGDRRRARLVAAGQEEREASGGQPRRQLTGPSGCALERGAHPPERVIAGGESGGAVELVEAIHVEEEQRKRVAAARPPPLRLEELLEA